MPVDKAYLNFQRGGSAMIFSMNVSFKKAFKASVFAVAMTAGVISSAQAEINVFRDPVTKVTASYPDRWYDINNQNPGDVLTIRAPNAPGHQDFAECKINTQADGRFKIFPVQYSAPIQRLYIAEDYWKQYLARYDDVVVHKGTSNNGLGDGFASMAQTSYTTPGGGKMRKRSIAFASLYNNVLYTVECSAVESSYHKWHNSFLSFIKSVDFHNRTNFALAGHYRDFINDKTLKVRGPSFREDSYFGVHNP